MRTLLELRLDVQRRVFGVDFLHRAGGNLGRARIGAGRLAARPPPDDVGGVDGDLLPATARPSLELGRQVVA